MEDSRYKCGKPRASVVRNYPAGCGPAISTHKAHDAVKRSRLSAPKDCTSTCREKISDDCNYGEPTLSTANSHVIVGPKKDSVYEHEKWSRKRLPDGSNGQKLMKDYKKQGIYNCNRSTVERNADSAREKVRKALRLFRAVCQGLLQGEEEKLRKQDNSHNRVDFKAARTLKDNGKYVHKGKQVIGPIPGIEVGDEFHYRMELNVVGLHLQCQSGIDYVKKGDKILATSIVASGSYDDDLDTADFLIYTGSGGNVINMKKKPEDQKLERFNLALMNSYHAQNHVRVIRGLNSTKDSDKSSAKARVGFTYTYDGLYLVERWWQESGPRGKLVYRFLLRRIPGQPELSWKTVEKSITGKTREGLCARDISQGRELNPICAVNNVDGEEPPNFQYTNGMIYPNWFCNSPAKGCNCTDGCSDVERCSCARKNGGEIPYGYGGALLKEKSLIYECGPLCGCPPSCRNRVTQRGIKFPLEIFKSRSRGWGVRSLSSIPSGSFVCEYAGELLQAKDAEERSNNEDYLFDIGTNNCGSFLWEGSSTLMAKVNSTRCEAVEDCGFTIDASQYGNVGRFINHSCHPNLYVQGVLYDHGDKRIPHVMLFAAEDIPAMRELTYHYNFSFDENCDCRRGRKRS